MKKTILFTLLLCVVLTFAFSGTVIAENSKAVESDAFSMFLTENSTGKELYSVKPDDKHEIASMVKIMSSLLVFESVERGELKYDENITISHNAAAMTGSEMFLDEGGSYSVGDLLKGVIVVSANDACIALAERIAGSESAFVDAMNARAAELGMTNTKFVNATGLPQEGQYSTARDVNRMTRELIKHKDYYGYAGIWLEDYSHPGGRITQLANTNKLIRHYSGCDSGKTGFTNSAKFCLSASAERNGMRLVSTVIGASSSKSRFKGVSDMFNYGFANYGIRSIKKAGESIENSVKVEGGKKKDLVLTVDRDVNIVSAKSDSADHTVDYVIPESVKAPIKKGDKIGKCVLSANGEVVDEYDIVAAEDVGKASWFDRFKDIADNFR